MSELSAIHPLPASPEEALAALDSIGRLGTATGWARAALIYALVGPAPGSGRRTHKEGFLLISDLAEKGIHGLRDRATIRRYRDAWEATGRPAELGQPVDLPTDEWPPSAAIKAAPPKPPAPAKRKSMSGRKPYHKPTPTESSRIDDKIRELYSAGYNGREIGEALDLAETSINHRRLALGLKGPKRYKTPAEKPPRYDWRDGAHPTSPPPPMYQRSTTLALWAAHLDTLTHDNAVNRLAFDVTDALRAGDTAWIENARRILTDAHAYLARLRELLDDDDARDQGMRESGITRQPLRVIRGSA